MTAIRWVLLVLLKGVAALSAQQAIAAAIDAKQFPSMNDIEVALIKDLRDTLRAPTGFDNFDAFVGGQQLQISNNDLVRPA